MTEPRQGDDRSDDGGYPIAPPMVTLRRHALDLVRQRCEAAADMRHVRLERINRSRPTELRYRTIDEVVREFMEEANAVSTFAVEVGLITSEEARRVILEIFASHPEMKSQD